MVLRGQGHADRASPGREGSSCTARDHERDQDDCNQPAHSTRIVSRDCVPRHRPLPGPLYVTVIAGDVASSVSVPEPDERSVVVHVWLPVAVGAFAPGPPPVFAP